MNNFYKSNYPLEEKRVQFGYTQKEISKFLGITQSQYSRVEKGKTNPKKHLKKLSEIFNCEPNEVFKENLFREKNIDFLKEERNLFSRTFHDKKNGFVYLKVDGWFTKKQIINNYEMLLNELSKWNVNENGIRWKYK